MGIDVHAKNVKLWKNVVQGRNGDFISYSISASRKQQDGTYKYKSMKLFTKVEIPEDIPNGAFCDIDGFLTVDTYPSANGEVSNIAVYATDISFKDREKIAGFEQVKEPVPF